MPWSVADVEKHNKDLSTSQKQKWVAIANGVLEEGGDEAKAIRIANAKVRESIDAIDIGSIMEASGDDHFYGAWQGGSKSGGGRPASGGSRLKPGDKLQDGSGGKAVGTDAKTLGKGDVMVDSKGQILPHEKATVQAEINANGGKAEFEALIGPDGKPAPARLIKTRYGERWAVFKSEEEANAQGGKVEKWLDRNDPKGYTVGKVERPAYVGTSTSDRSGAKSYAPRPKGKQVDTSAKVTTTASDLRYGSASMRVRNMAAQRAYKKGGISKDEALKAGERAASAWAKAGYPGGENPSATDVERFFEASGDDHYYGAWTGGSKSAGGRPGGGGKVKPGRVSGKGSSKVGDRPVDHMRLVRGEDGNRRVEGSGTFMDGSVYEGSDEFKVQHGGQSIHQWRGDGQSKRDAAKTIGQQTEGDANLARMKVEGSMPFGGGWVERADMPQITSSRMPDYLSDLRARGVSVKTTTADPTKLKPVQRNISARKTNQMRQSVRTNERNINGKPTLISSDGYVIDGHHRWAAQTVEGWTNPMRVPVIRVGMPAKDLVRDARTWGEKEGIARKNISESRVWYSEARDNPDPAYWADKGIFK